MGFEASTHLSVNNATPSHQDYMQLKVKNLSNILLMCATNNTDDHILHSLAILVLPISFLLEAYTCTCTPLIFFPMQPKQKKTWP